MFDAGADVENLHPGVIIDVVEGHDVCVGHVDDVDVIASADG